MKLLSELEPKLVRNFYIQQQMGIVFDWNIVNLLKFTYCLVIFMFVIEIIPSVWNSWYVLQLIHLTKK